MSNKWPHDISDQSKLEALEMALDNLPVGIGLFRPGGRAIFMNEALRTFYHGDEWVDKRPTFEELIDRGFFDNWRPPAREHFARVHAALAKGEDYQAEVEVGDRILCIHDRPLPGGLLLSTQQDVTRRIEAERAATHLANHDVLTGLANRGAFAQHLAETIDKAQRSQQKFAVLAVDLDRFKDINDVFGHATGDTLLQEMACRFEGCSGGNFLARLGGDEFSFIVSDGRQPEAAAALANNLIEAAGREVTCQGQSLVTSISVGVAVYPVDGTDAATLLSNADAALYRAKADGRGVVRSFEKDMDRRIHEQRRMQQDLKLAIARDEFQLFYQPQARTHGEIYGFEALLRWQHPQQKLISPEKFIPVAEESGLIVEIGQWVIREACREAASWKHPLSVAVNVSPVQFRHGSLADFVHGVLIETGLPAHRLEIEITEGVLVHDFARALHQLRKLKNLGVHIAMDDFGTGYSSLSYLQAFPFDTLKIDRSFVKRLGQGQHSDEIVRAVIGLGRGLNLPIVAEGVETTEQLEFLRSEQCQSVQGYLLGAPQPIEQFARITNGEDTAPHWPSSLAS